MEWQKISDRNLTKRISAEIPPLTPGLQVFTISFENDFIRDFCSGPSYSYYSPQRRESKICVAISYHKTRIWLPQRQKLSVTWATFAYLSDRHQLSCSMYLCWAVAMPPRSHFYSYMQNDDLSVWRESWPCQTSTVCLRSTFHSYRVFLLYLCTRTKEVWEACQIFFSEYLLGYV